MMMMQTFTSTVWHIMDTELSEVRTSRRETTERGVAVHEDISCSWNREQFRNGVYMDPGRCSRPRRPGCTASRRSTGTCGTRCSRWSRRSTAGLPRRRCGCHNSLLSASALRTCCHRSTDPNCGRTRSPCGQKILWRSVEAFWNGDGSNFWLASFQLQHSRTDRL